VTFVDGEECAAGAWASGTGPPVTGDDGEITLLEGNVLYFGPVGRCPSRPAAWTVRGRYSNVVLLATFHRWGSGTEPFHG
jgi:hypothetical protein